MDKFPIEEFKRDFIIKTLVQQTQFEQWLKLFFFLNNELIEKYDFIYQDAFYTKFYELFTEGLVFANKILDALQKGDNDDKRNWYIKLVDGLKDIKSELTDEEFEYIRYRRHSCCHIFQNSYEYIQDNFRIKKERNGRKLQDIQKDLQGLILKYGSDKNIDHHINEKLQKKLTALYNWSFLNFFQSGNKSNCISRLALPNLPTNPPLTPVNVFLSNSNIPSAMA